MFLKILLASSFTTHSAKFGEFDSWNVILFQIKVLVEILKETTLFYKIKITYFIEVFVTPALHN